MLKEKLEESVTITGEGLLFQALELRPTELHGSYYFATIEVSSPTRFEFLLGAPEASARTIAEILYGDPAVVESSKALGDIVAELANTIAGTLARNYDDEKSVVISTPASGYGRLDRELEECSTFASDEVELVIAIREF